MDADLEDSLWLFTAPALGLAIFLICVMDPVVTFISAVVLFISIWPDIRPLVSRRALVVAFFVSLVHPANMNVVLLLSTNSISHHVLLTVSSQRIAETTLLDARCGCSAL